MGCCETNFNASVDLEHENCDFKGATATKSLRNRTKHVKLLAY
jgi:hypothetical protein